MPSGIAGPVHRGVGASDDEAVDDHLDGVPLVLVERRRLRQVVRLTVDADPHEALLPGRLEDPVTLGLAVLDERAQDEKPRFLRHREHLIDDLLDGLALDLAAALRAVRMTDPGKEQTKVVVDLGDRPDRRSGVPAGALLVDGNGR